jgi:hypothetical protein
MNNKEKQELMFQAKEILESGDKEVIRAFKKTIEGVYSLFLINEKRSAKDETKSEHFNKERGKPSKSGKRARPRPR